MAAEPPAVAILGAGIAGLVAAHELERLGHSVIVLEGSGRIGGRVFTHRFGSADNAPYADLGAMRIPTGHALTMRYVDELGLTPALRPFRTILSDPNNYLATGRGFVRVRDAAGPVVEDLRCAVPVDSFRRDTVLFCAWLAALARAVGPRALRTGLAAEITPMLRAADRVDLSSYVHGPADRFDLVGAFDTHPQLREACGVRLAGFIDDLLLETGTRLRYLAGGMGRITDRLAARLRGPVLLDREVVSLHVRGDQVLVGLRHRGVDVLSRYPVAVCTLPFSVLRELQLAGLDDDKREVIRSVEYAAATKIALHCREPFWKRAAVSGGASATGGRLRQTYYLPQDGDPALGAVLLGSYAIAEDAAPLGRLPADRRHAASLEELAGLHPELKAPGAVLGAASISWGDHRWSKGCAAHRWRWGKDAAAARAEGMRAARPQGGLFFAGEHCSSTPAWINGAIEAALAVTGAVDAALRTGAADRAQRS
ncbi:FAD-dependent oxidoreductase [Saccharopolyspora sp. HNM0986]|uniref:flavin monoamine oxidase family protein n=1 Tax=Saccharopolyspora galaxeae TaxID=2781241 RepID=UPI00190B65E0|nr:NAD(P)/FAD-dependent oxidoreductase [Saccharopolyspora sp. HNM0986]MBK0867552.1 FAD-dependent oxidoreductase [Saccharopolyspora sp. HNM0986]